MIINFPRFLQNDKLRNFPDEAHSRAIKKTSFIKIKIANHQLFQLLKPQGTKKKGIEHEKFIISTNSSITAVATRDKLWKILCKKKNKSRMLSRTFPLQQNQNHTRHIHTAHWIKNINAAITIPACTIFTSHFDEEQRQRERKFSHSFLHCACVASLHAVTAAVAPLFLENYFWLCFTLRTSSKWIIFSFVKDELRISFSSIASAF